MIALSSFMQDISRFQAQLEIEKKQARVKMERMREERRYVSYLLRLWQAEGQEGLVWRASLEHASTGERRGFACLADLFAFLEQETAPVDEDDDR